MFIRLKTKDTEPVHFLPSPGTIDSKIKTVTELFSLNSIEPIHTAITQLSF